MSPSSYFPLHTRFDIKRIGNEANENPKHKWFTTLGQAVCEPLGYFFLFFFSVLLVFSLFILKVFHFIIRKLIMVIKQGVTSPHSSIRIPVVGFRSLLPVHFQCVVSVISFLYSFKKKKKRKSF